MQGKADQYHERLCDIQNPTERSQARLAANFVYPNCGELSQAIGSPHLLAVLIAWGRWGFYLGLATSMGAPQYDQDDDEDMLDRVAIITGGASGIYHGIERNGD